MNALLAVACALAVGSWVSPEARTVRVAAGSGGIVTVSEQSFDRMFTGSTATYDLATRMLLSGSIHASCCGGRWTSTVARNGDGTYDVTKVTDTFNLTDAEHMHYHGLPPGAFVTFGSDRLIPWIVAKQHPAQIYAIDINPLHFRQLTVADSHLAPPAGVPKGDRVLAMSSWDSPQGKRTTYLWYDPCTFSVDAEGSDAEHALIYEPDPKTSP